MRKKTFTALPALLFLVFCFARLAAAVGVRAVRVPDVGDRQVEVAGIVRQAGHAGRGDGDAVIALGPGDDLLLPRGFWLFQ